MVKTELEKAKIANPTQRLELPSDALRVTVLPPARVRVDATAMLKRCQNQLIAGNRLVYEVSAGGYFVIHEEAAEISQGHHVFDLVGQPTKSLHVWVRLKDSRGLILTSAASKTMESLAGLLKVQLEPLEEVPWEVQLRHDCVLLKLNTAKNFGVDIESALRASSPSTTHLLVLGAIVFDVTLQAVLGTDSQGRSRWFSYMSQIDDSLEPEDVETLADALALANEFRKKWFESFELVTRYVRGADGVGGSYAP